MGVKPQVVKHLEYAADHWQKEANAAAKLSKEEILKALTADKTEVSNTLANLNLDDLNMVLMKRLDSLWKENCGLFNQDWSDCVENFKWLVVGAENIEKTVKIFITMTKNFIETKGKSIKTNKE